MFGMMLAGYAPDQGFGAGASNAMRDKACG
jgi:hypothetical protein